VIDLMGQQRGRAANKTCRAQPAGYYGVLQKGAVIDAGTKLTLREGNIGFEVVCFQVALCQPKIQKEA